ncbi:class I SAM-dependent methyltransferase [Marinimicrobium locisalis]|uniref:class I SAM-dependent methyltransferase n=1 Tax=Marinimicrobium locisalis TaxID=546022 RepID=UPI0032213E00
MNVKGMSLERIQSLDYFEMIGVVKETNRPPGGSSSIRGVALNSFLNEKSKVLEVGTSTGVTAIELAKMVKCNIQAIDINDESLKEARARAEAAAVGQYIDFSVGDASQTKFDDESFDMVFCGNVTSYFDSKEKVIDEFNRVLVPNGHIAAIPMYYIDKPSEELVNKVSEAINVDITPLYLKDWVKYYDMPCFENVWMENYRFDRVSDENVARYVDSIFSQPHLAELDEERKAALYDRYRYFMFLFRDNLSLMGYTPMLLRKALTKDEPELFVSSKV